MQYLRAEICQFGCFVERNLLYLPGGIHDPRICRHHAVDVGPDLNLLDIERRPRNRSRIIRTTAPECRYGSRECRRDISTHDNSTSGVEVGSRGLLQTLCSDIHDRGGLSKAFICYDTLPGIDVQHVKSK